MFWIVFSLLLLLLLSIPIWKLLFYRYIKWKYYNLHGTVPGIEPELFYGNLRQLGVITSNKEIIDSYLHSIAKLQKLYGDIFQFWLGSNHFYVFCRPDHAEQIYHHRNAFDRAEMHKNTFGLISEGALITLIGPQFKRHAKIVLPMLKKHKFITQISMMTNCVDRLIEIWKERYENKPSQICTCLVNDNQLLLLDLFTLLTFDYDFGNLKYLYASARSINEGKQYQPSDLSQALTIWLGAFRYIRSNGMPAIVNYYLLKFNRKYQKAYKTLEDYAEKIIDKCQHETHTNEKPNNLIASLVLSLQKDETNEQQKSEENKIGITKKELLGEVLSLILGGFETTAAIISWFIYYASKNPHVQQKIRDELEQNGITKEASLDDIHRLNQCKYVDCVIKETLRIQPLTLGSARTLIDDITIDGIQLHKGQNIISAFGLMQNDPRYWKLDPTLFSPERFYDTDGADIHHHPLVFSPFGGGHRVCAGQELARLELKVILIRLMLSVTFIDAPGNNDGHWQRMSILPKELAVYIKFD